MPTASEIAVGILSRGAASQLGAFRLLALAPGLGAPFHWLHRGARVIILARRKVSVKVLCSRAYNELLALQKRKTLCLSTA
jgi:hypothetical protein